MRKMPAIILIISGTIFSIFIFNIVMYAFVPSYRSMLQGAAGQEEDIPVVDVREMPEDISFDQEEDSLSASINDSRENLEAVLVEMGASEEVPLASSVESTEKQEPERQIIGKEYHEDCGTGAGYWVITYDDGSTGIEQN